MTRFVRVWLPVIVVVGGVVAIALAPSDIRWEGGLGIIGAGLSIWMINVLFRIGATGDRERDEEERARAYFDRHGRWPDD
ncbi:MAG TPA: hypothetical protein VFT42_03280 [Solirubrobacteraceae bacterium]|nr:hypothetical protein [Solirubrobacteraceae bacterium]